MYRRLRHGYGMHGYERRLVGRWDEANVGGNVGIVEDRFLVAPVRKAFEVFDRTRPSQQGCRDVGMLVALGLDLSDNPKVRSGAAHCEKEIGFIILGTYMNRSIASDNRHFENVIRGRTMGLGQITHPAG